MKTRHKEVFCTKIIRPTAYPNAARLLRYGGSQLPMQIFRQMTSVFEGRLTIRSRIYFSCFRLRDFSVQVLVLVYKYLFFPLLQDTL